MTTPEDELLRRLESAIQDLHAADPTGASAGLPSQRNAALREIAQCTGAIRSSAMRARSIIDAALDAFISIDRSGLIVEWNGRAEEIFGWQKSEVIGQSLAETIIPTSYRDAHRRGLQRFIETGEGHVVDQRIEVTALRRDGSEFPIVLKVFVPEPSATTECFNAFIRDTSE